jgi:DNA-binding transcriptional MerR regulator
MQEIWDYVVANPWIWVGVVVGASAARPCGLTTVTKLHSQALGIRGNARSGRTGPARMLIGELARLAGASVQAVRLYERRGLMREPERTASGYRVYRPLDLEILKAIKRCQSLGLTLAETKRITRILEKTRRRDGALSPDRDRECLEEIEQIGLQKFAMLDARLRESSATKDELSHKVLM